MDIAENRNVGGDARAEVLLSYRRGVERLRWYFSTLVVLLAISRMNQVERCDSLYLVVTVIASAFPGVRLRRTAGSFQLMEGNQGYEGYASETG